MKPPLVWVCAAYRDWLLNYTKLTGYLFLILSKILKTWIPNLIKKSIEQSSIPRVVFLLFYLKRLYETNG